MRSLSTKILIWSIANVSMLALGLTSLGTVSAKNNKADICHYQEETDSWKLISVGQSAAGAHLEHHDDAFPGETTSQTGTVLDADCVEGAVTCPCEDGTNELLSDIPSGSISSVPIYDCRYDDTREAGAIGVIIQTPGTNSGREILWEIFIRNGRCLVFSRYGSAEIIKEYVPLIDVTDEEQAVCTNIFAPIIENLLEEVTGMTCDITP